MAKKDKITNEILICAYQLEEDKVLKKKLASDIYKRVDRLIYKMISLLESKFYVPPFIKEDMYLEANLIFMRCINKFDTTKKIKFSTYLSDALYYELKRFNKKQITHTSNTYDLEIDEILQAKHDDIDAMLDDKYNIEKIQETLVKLNNEQKITDKQFNTIIEEHGFFGKNKKSRKQMADERGCSLQNIGFLYRKAITRVKEELENNTSLKGELVNG